MHLLNNYENIKKIEFNKTIYPFCPIGGDNYAATINVIFFPDKYYMDYCEVDKAICELSNQKLTIEQVAEKVYQILSYFSPKDMIVIVHGKSNRHFEVVVTKTLTTSTVNMYNNEGVIYSNTQNIGIDSID